jgi:hypothetical protein
MALSFKKILLNNIDSLLIAIAGFVFILMMAHYGGIGVSPDSIAYTSAAKSFITDGTFIQYDEMPYVDFPVGYPIFLSIFFKLFGTDFVHVGVYINASLFAALIFLCGYLINSFTYTSRLYKIVILICIALSPALLEIYSMLWSETLFIFLVVLFIAVLYQYINRLTITSLFIAAIIVAAVCVTRYAGISIIAAGGFVLLFAKHQSIKQKIIHILLYGAVACSMLIGNLIRNSLIEGHVTGAREKSLTGLFANITYFGRVLCDWFPFTFNHYAFAGVFGLIVILLLITAVLWHLISGKDKNTVEYITTVFATVYILFIIITATISRFETLNSRFISPAFVLLLLILSYWLNRLVVATKGGIKILCILVTIIVGAAFVWNEYKISYQSYDDLRGYGIPGYTDDEWKLSPTVQYIQSHKDIFSDEYEVYSNANDAVYFFTGHTAQQLPHKQALKETRDFYMEDHVYLVWFYLGDNPDLIPLNDILKNKPMKLVNQFSDGAVYRIE